MKVLVVWLSAAVGGALAVFSMVFPLFLAWAMLRDGYTPAESVWLAFACQVVILAFAGGFVTPLYLADRDGSLYYDLR